MLNKINCTPEELKALLKTKVSEKRYIHSLGVAQTAELLLKHYNCTNYEKEWNGISAGTFCGLAHDFTREYTDQQWYDYFKEKKLEVDEDQKSFPVLMHGVASAEYLKEIVGDYPQSWYKAIAIHTVGDTDMDDLALALFIADFIEPSRTFLTDEKRNQYLAKKTIYECAYAVLCDMMEHWKTKSSFQSAKATYRMKEDLEKRLTK